MLFIRNIPLKKDLENLKINRTKKGMPDNT